ncbi:MAG: MBL fold metallo-hydrolase [Candidatus Spechtbacteria bacterium]|nr:MBL fold metallo-hydrolase [Candidatus Spechtbacteria bacterium]
MTTKNQKYILSAFTVIAFIALALAYVSSPSGALEVHFLDIGQGDGIFIETPNGRQVLIDGGKPDSPILGRLGSHMSFYDRSIDIVVATHMDADHMGGLISVLESFEVGSVFVGSNIADTELSRVFWQTIKDKDIPVVLVKAGDSFELEPDINMSVVSPWGGLSATASDNDSSLVMKLVYKEDSFLFTADIEKPTEYKLVFGGADISAEVLKVGHHGSNSSSTKYFLSKVNPKISVIQVGENNYGHPRKEVLGRLSKTKILRNDLNGDISIYSYGNSI